jgi:amino acid transporter
MSSEAAAAAPRLKRALSLWDLVFCGIILIQPTAPMPLFGVVHQEARGHVVTTILIGMVAMLFTAISYGRMARAYPLAGSAYTYVGREIHPALGYVTGWSMAMDYMINPILCVVWCSKAAGNIAPEILYEVWVVFFALLFTGLNLRGIRATARTNEVLAAGMGVVVLLVFIAAARYVLGLGRLDAAFFTTPFYDPRTFSLDTVFTGASIAVLTYIGFDGISTLSEEAHNPRQNILLATVLTCLVTGILASLEVYAAQLVWHDGRPFPDVDTAYVHVAGRAGGAWLLQLVNFTLLVASIGSGSAAQLAGARLLYGMGRDNAIPRSFFGVISTKRNIPRNNVLFTGALALGGAFVLSYQLAAELLNFGAFIAFMGVNLAAFTRYFLRADEKKWTNAVPPLLGFAICFYIWLNLRTPARIAGFAWLAVGIVYGAWRTKGFRRDLVRFEAPSEDPPEAEQVLQPPMNADERR